MRAFLFLVLLLGACDETTEVCADAGADAGPCIPPCPQCRCVPADAMEACPNDEVP